MRLTAKLAKPESDLAVLFMEPLRPSSSPSASLPFSAPAFLRSDFFAWRFVRDVPWAFSSWPGGF